MAFVFHSGDKTRVQGQSHGLESKSGEAQTLDMYEQMESEK